MPYLHGIAKNTYTEVPAMISVRAWFINMILSQTVFHGFVTTLVVSCVWLQSANAADNNSFEHVVAPFLKSYCVDCHGGDDPDGERRLDELSGLIGDTNSLVEYQDVLDQLNLDAMPPAEAEQPPLEMQRQVTQWLTGRIAEYHAQHKRTDGETVLRRLNAREYRNTVRDLLHLNMTMFDPTEGFPREQTSEHLDNIGASLVTSGYLLAKYLSAAEQVIDKALFPLERPPEQNWSFHDNLHQQPEIDQVHGKTHNFAHLTLYDVVGADKHEGAYAPLHDFADGVPADGWYEIRFTAEALNRLHPFDDEYLGTDRHELLRLGIVAGNKHAGPLHKPQPLEPLLAEVELQDGSQEVTLRVWLDRGYTPRFTFRNGLIDARNLWNRTIKKYPDQFPEPTRSGIVEARYLAIKHGKFPQIQIDDIVIRGPLIDSWPTASQRALLGDDWEAIVAAGKLSEEQLRKHLARFATRAYRRPVRPAELERLLALVAVRQEAGGSGLEAFADGLKAVLCSPHFLYLNEPPSAVDEAHSNMLDDHALASRLSLFLWSSIPDEELLELANQGKLSSPEELARQAERMLRDPKSDAFVHDFLDSWLTLRELGASPPDRDSFEAFYHYDLGSAMRTETQLFTRHLLDQNLPISNFIDSDFTFVNKQLARHYGLQVSSEERWGNEFRRVALSDGRRGGLLGQASVLTVTANGIDTSPVVRGIWLLENILGTPPSPPPPDVEPLDPDVRGALTIREQLEKHRSVASCYDCHRKIDPPGFALENFDAIGGWRDAYDGRAKIDAAGELPGGKSFSDVRGFKQILLEQQPQFARALVEKLLAYSMGRHLDPLDRPHIDAILAATEVDGYRFRDVVQQIVLSESFRGD